VFCLVQSHRTLDARAIDEATTLAHDGDHRATTMRLRVAVVIAMIVAAVATTSAAAAHSRKT
jgi:hypothetical protein